MLWLLSMSGSDFGVCFELGRALRRGDVEAFFNVYDKLIPKNAQVSLFRGCRFAIW